MNRSYSRRELYAFGEPLGESVTRRKAGGGLILGDGGGGGGGQSASQTQVSDLPEWAKPYAKETLGKGQALTQTPYQTYGGERQAGFTPLQQQSFGGAAQMQPSQLGAQAGQLAGAATMGALGTNYNPYETGGFTSQTAGQYMNPYLEQAMEPQLREAQRASQMQGVVDQGQAVRSGAFGGSRQGIVEAERQRNLGQLQGDIRAKGYMSAFDQAQQNFAREQQLREQSRQYGAGLGLQGLQTALQGAGQMGQLGGQQFAQGMDINKLQNLYGQQQQAQEQAGLTQKYQDFQAQQKHPYQQLEFMSNLLRGTPMGTVNTLYQPPPSTLGQIAGLGAGLYGTFGKAEGGMVDSYAEGGVTSDQNVESILSKLSNEQLAQAKQIAIASQDMERVQMIDQELAERASMSQGLGGAFNQLPQEAQQNVIQAANGGMLSFSNGGINPEFDVGDPESPSSDPFANLKKVGLSSGFSDLGRLVRGGKSTEEYYGEEKNRPYLPAAPGAEADAETAKLARLAASREPAPAPARAAPAPAAKPTKGVQAAANAVAGAVAQTTGVKRTGMKDAFAEGLSLLKDTQSEADSKRMVDLINKVSKSDAPDKMDMLAQFGFKMAEAASKSGATLLDSFTGGAQVIPQMQAQAKKDAKEAQKLGITLEMEKLKLDAATRKGDRAAALQHAQNIRIMEGQEAQLDLTGQQLAETKRSNVAREGLQGQQIAAQAARAKAAETRAGETYARIRAANTQKALADARKGWGDVLERKKLEAEFGPGQAGFLKYHKSLFDNLQLQFLPQLELIGSNARASAED